MIASDSLIIDIDYDDDSSSLQLGATDRFKTARSSSNTTVVTYWSFLSAPFRQEGRAIMSRLAAFGSLKNNWDSYGAVAPSREVIQAAINFVRKAETNLLPFYFAAPGPNGEVVIEFRNGSKEAAVYFNSDGTNELVLMRGGDVILEGLVEQNYQDLVRFINSKDA